MKFNMKRPCANCPFLKAAVQPLNEGWLGEGHAADIVDTLSRKDGSFSCHKSVPRDEKYDVRSRIEEWEEMEISDEEIERRVAALESEARRQSEFCAGALLLQKKLGMPGRPSRFAIISGLVNPALFTPENLASVVDTEEEFVSQHEFKQGRCASDRK